MQPSKYSTNLKSSNLIESVGDDSSKGFCQLYYFSGPSCSNTATFVQGYAIGKCMTTDIDNGIIHSFQLKYTPESEILNRILKHIRIQLTSPLLL
jgi:hypothetical protein